MNPIKQGIEIAKGAAATGLFIVIAVLLFRQFRNKGEGTHKVPPVDPENLNPATDYQAIADELFSAFDGLDWTSTKGRAIEKALALNDDEFREVYVRYNRTYKTPPETLRTDFESELIWGSGARAFRQRFDELQLP